MGTGEGEREGGGERRQGRSEGGFELTDPPFAAPLWRSLSAWIILLQPLVTGFQAMVKAE